jgi:hypothetical protein
LTAYNEYGKKGKIIAKYLLTYPWQICSGGTKKSRLYQPGFQKWF